MDNNIKIKIDEVLQEISQVNDLNQRVDILTYMQQQSGFMLWQLEEDIHVDQNMRNI